MRCRIDLYNLYEDGILSLYYISFKGRIPMISITYDSCEVKENAEAAKKLVDEINDLFGDLGSDSCLSLAEAEHYILEGTQALGQKLLELYAFQQASAKEPETVSCPKCEKSCRSWRKRERQITTLCGVIRVERWVYHCDAKHYHTPWDMKQQLKGSYTHRVAEKMCRFAANFDYRGAAEELSRQGIDVSHTTLNKKVREWSKDLRALEQVDLQTLGANERWYVSTDGCHTNSLEGWKETKVGCIFRDYPQLGPNGISRARPESIRYTANRQNAEQCGKDLYALATGSGIYREDIMKQEVVFIGDGAPWIWNNSDEYFPNAVEIVDYMHAKSHLYDAAKYAFGEHAIEKVETWTQKVEPLLFEGKITEVASHIRSLETENPDERKNFEREAGYFEKHTNRMQYKTFREKGYQITSSVIESACKHVVAQRCRRASMRWTDEGLNAILELRCILKNKTWDKYWYPDTIAA